MAFLQLLFCACALFIAHGYAYNIKEGYLTYKPEKNNEVGFSFTYSKIMDMISFELI